MAELADHTCRTVSRVQDRFNGVFVKDGLMTAGTLKLPVNVFPSFLFGVAVQVVVHDDPLAERLVGRKAKGIVQLRQPDKENHCAVFGIHLKVEEDLEVIQDGTADIVCLIQDNDRRFLLVQGKPVDLACMARKFSVLR